MNKVILKQMIRLSRIIKEIKEARAKLTSVNSQANYFIIDGDSSSFLKQKITNSVTDCLYMEKYLRLSVSNACKCLDGYLPLLMEPIDYISSNDIKNKFVYLCLGKKVVATIDLTTGMIKMVEEPEYEETTEEKRPVAKS